jgi:hypothetical protein
VGEHEPFRTAFGRAARRAVRARGGGRAWGRDDEIGLAAFNTTSPVRTARLCVISGCGSAATESAYRRSGAFCPCPASCQTNARSGERSAGNSSGPVIYTSRKSLLLPKPRDVTYRQRKSLCILACGTFGADLKSSESTPPWAPSLPGGPARAGGLARRALKHPKISCR